jgi:hypothetical protein
MKIMKQENNVAKSNIITLNILPKGKPVSDELLLQIEDEIVANKLVENAMDIANKIDIKGYALVAWDERGVPCIAWQVGHPKNPISEMMLPVFTQSCFQGIVNRKLSTPEDLKNE